MGIDDLVIKLEKENKALRHKLERVNESRILLEFRWDRNANMFQTLNTEIEKANKELQEVNEEIKAQRDELARALDDLKKTQDQLIQSEKMAALGGLVAGVAHEINTPVGVSVTAASSLVEETRKMAEHYKEGTISKADFKDYLNTANQSALLILSNMQRTAEMVQSFKQVSADQSTACHRRR